LNANENNTEELAITDVNTMIKEVTGKYQFKQKSKKCRGRQIKRRKDPSESGTGTDIDHDQRK